MKKELLKLLSGILFLGSFFAIVGLIKTYPHVAFGMFMILFAHLVGTYIYENN
jgi:hypothetical protein